MAKLAIQGTCLCEAVQLGVARLPRQVTQCNCSVCRRYGTLWAYYRRSAVMASTPTQCADIDPKWLARYMSKGIGLSSCSAHGRGSQPSFTGTS